MAGKPEITARLRRGEKALLLQAIAMMGCAIAIACLTPAAAQGNRSTMVDAKYTDAGTESCLRCHGGEKVALMAETGHGDSDNPYSPFAQRGCESCHGPGSLHVSRARGGAGFPALLRFGDKATRPQQTAACLDCHAQDMGDAAGMEWTGSLHDTPRITCVSCHQLHTTEDPLADQAQQTASCARCHEDEIVAHRRFENQSIVFDELVCYDCHDVHQLVPKGSE